MPVQIMVNMLALLFALSLAGPANAQQYGPGDSAILVSGDAPLVNKFENALEKARKDSKLPKGCLPQRFPNTVDPVYGKQGGLLVTCKPGDAANGYALVGELFLNATDEETNRRLGMARTILQSCTNAQGQQGQQCQTYPCPARPDPDEERPRRYYIEQYYFGCFTAGNACQEAGQCTKK